MPPREPPHHPATGKYYTTSHLRALGKAKSVKREDLGFLLEAHYDGLLKFRHGEHDPDTGEFRHTPGKVVVEMKTYKSRKVLTDSLSRAIDKMWGPKNYKIRPVRS